MVGRSCTNQLLNAGFRNATQRGQCISLPCRLGGLGAHPPLALLRFANSPREHKASDRSRDQCYHLALAPRRLLFPHLFPHSPPTSLPPSDSFTLRPHFLNLSTEPSDLLAALDGLARPLPYNVTTTYTTFTYQVAAFVQLRESLSSGWRAITPGEP